MVPVNNKMFNVEVMVQRDDKSNKKVDLGHVPLKIQLSMETNNLGKLSVEIRNLKKDLQIFLSVENNEIKEKIQLVLFKLEEKIQKLPFELKALSCNVNPKPDQSPSILLPPKYKVFSMKRIEGVV
jgi:hypothetical protein